MRHGLAVIVVLTVCLITVRWVATLLLLYHLFNKNKHGISLTVSMDGLFYKVIAGSVL